MNPRHPHLVFALLAISLGLMLVVVACRVNGAQRSAQTFDGVKMKSSLPPMPDDPPFQSTSLHAPAPPLVMTNVITLTWTQTNNAIGWTCSGWVIEESNDLRTWAVVKSIPNTNNKAFMRLTNTYPAAFMRLTNSFTSSANPAFWRVGTW